MGSGEEEATECCLEISIFIVTGDVLNILWQVSEGSCKLVKMQFLIPVIQDLLLVSGVVGFMYYRINLNYSDYTCNYDKDFEDPWNNWLKETVIFYFA